MKFLMLFFAIFCLSCIHGQPAAVQKLEQAELLVDVLRDLGAKSEGIQPDGTALTCEPIGKWGTWLSARDFAGGRAQMMLIRIHPENDASYVEGNKKYTPFHYATRYYRSRDWACARAMR